jgi:hypothetical protein
MALPSGVYKYAVKAVYVNNVLSLPAFSNEIHKGMIGTLAGTVYDAGSGSPIAGVQITAGSYSGTSNAQGAYSLEVYQGTYTVYATKTGYSPWTQDNVVIQGLQTTTLNITMQELYLSPNNVLASVAANNNTVNLSWNAPGTGISAWIYYDSGENDDSIGTGGTADFDVAIRFPASALMDYVGTSLQAVKVWPAQDGALSIRVWTGGTPTAPGTMVVDQSFTPVLNTYNTVVLNTPVPVTGTEELWFGYRCNVTGGYPAGCDAGPAVNGFGNMIYFQGAWSTLLALAPSLDYNWNIRGFVGFAAPTALSPGAPLGAIKAPSFSIGDKYKPDNNNSNKRINTAQKQINNLDTPETNNERNLLGYKVWRFIQGQEANEALWTLITPSTITATAYQDNGWGSLPDATYKWGVKAVYSGNILSAPAFSNAVVRITQIGTIAGIVRNLQNVPITGATISCGTVTATTNASGAYAMDVVSGTHSVTASHPGYEAYTHNGVVVNTGQTTPVNFQLTPTQNLLVRGFESYPDFATVFAPWTSLDIDQQMTYGYTGVTWPGSQSPIPFMVFNPGTTTPPVTNIPPHTGAKLAVAIASTTPPNNDWLITPQVSNPTMFRFWARSLTNQYGLERFKVGVSITGTNPGDFTIISGANYLEAPVNWTEYSYDLSNTMAMFT